MTDTAQIETAVRAALDRIALPGGGTLGESDMLRAVTVKPDGAVSFVIEAPSAGVAGQMGPLKEAAETLVGDLPGVTGVSVIVTAHGPAPAAKAPDLKIGRHPTPGQGKTALPGIGRIIAVGSGKGGVGKSTVSANLAVAMARQGVRTGLLDADIYGPSQPRMMGITKRAASADGKIIEPIRAHGVTVMSIGMMLDPDKAVVWRGPMLMGALQQLLGQVRWGDLDVLIVDLPPGTGDIQLTLCQRYEVAGALVVSTPQDVALLDARKAIDAFATLKTPVLGLVENMSTYACPHCGKASHPFGTGGVAAEAEARGIAFLGALPLALSVREAGDGGVPVAASGDPAGAAYDDLAVRLLSDESE